MDQFQDDDRFELLLQIGGGLMTFLLFWFNDISFIFVTPKTWRNDEKFNIFQNGWFNNISNASSCFLYIIPFFKWWFAKNSLATQ